MKEFDYIIAGGGASGLTLAYLLLAPEYRKKSILLIEKQAKTENDRTWCFWEKGENLFENLVAKSWPKAKFRGHNFNKTYELAPYQYKMIRGIDFYEFIYSKLKQANNFTIVQEEITEVYGEGTVQTKTNHYKGQLVFDSTLNYQSSKLFTPKTLLQHFKGLVIETKKPCFEEDTVTYMDFSIPQEGDCRFGYVLPFSTNKALIEYTVFNQYLLDDKQYDERLDAYLRKLGITEYKVLETETGIIPMSDYPFTLKVSDSVYQIGIKGGFAKASTGYSFLRTQKILKRLVANLHNNKPLDQNLPYQKKRFKKYDSTLLGVLANGKFTGDEIFSSLFKKNGIKLMFKFLDEETSLAEEMKIMSSTPIRTFGTEFIRSIPKPVVELQKLSD